MKHFIALLFLQIPFSILCYGTVRLPAVFSNGMVLQQKSSVAVWGTSAAQRQITVQGSWDNIVYKTTADQTGNWKLKLKTPEAGGPFILRISDGDILELSDVLIGEVWLCSGQSNMEMPMTGYHNQPVWNGNDDLADAGNSQLRLFHIPHAVSVDPQTEGKGSWAHAGPGSAAGFSAVGFRFAQRLQAILKVPVGMIQATWGGTPIEAWMDGESLRQCKQTEIPVPVAGEKADRLKPTCLYNGMIHPVGGYGIKGFLWYQGEANVGRPAAYSELMQGMIQGWRKQWKNDDLFFYFVQIAPWNYGKRKDSTPYLREAQAIVAREVPGTGMVVSIDKGSATTVHPPDKKAISDRLLYWALGNAYGREGISYRSPEYEKMEIRKDSAILNFREAPQGLYATGDQIAGFEMAGEDQKFYPARARVFKRTVIVLSAQVKKPVAVRYAFTDMVTGNLYSGAGIPVAPFRTDNW